MNKLILVLFIFSLNKAYSSESISELLLGLEYGPKGLTFQVRSGGCTDKNDFNIQLIETSPLSIKLIRTNKRMCRAFIPYGTKVHYTYEELGIKEGSIFNIQNKLGQFYN